MGVSARSTVALLGWTDQGSCLAPPMLESALNASHSSFARHIEAVPASLHFERAAASLSAAGVRDGSTQVAMHHIAAPLISDVREALEARTAMFRNAPPEPTATWQECQTVLRGDRPGDLLDDPTYRDWFSSDRLRTSQRQSTTPGDLTRS